MEREFKWIGAVVGETCHWCRREIPQGRFFYFEVVARRTFCRECGRAIRMLGYDAAARALSPDPYDKVFRSMDGLFSN